MAGVFAQVLTRLDAIFNKTAASGTAGTASANVLSVQGIAGGTVLPVSAAQSGAWSVSLTGPAAVTQSGAWSVGRTWSLSSATDSIAVTGTFWQATQPVSLTTLPSLVAGAARIGFSVSGVSMTSQSTTNQLAGASVTGAINNVITSLSGAGAQTSSNAKEYRACISSNVTCDLYIEASNDNFTTTYRIKGISAAVATGATLYYAEIILSPIFRYYRCVGKNTSGSTSTTFIIADSVVTA